jgi:hypothetical protein
MTTVRRRVATVAAVVLLPLGAWQVASYAAAGGNGQGNNGAGNGNGGSSTTTPAKSLVASFVSATKVAPGVSGSVTVSVYNPNNQAVTLTAASGTVTGVNRTGCNKAWIVLGAWPGPQVALGAKSYTTLDLPLSFDDKATNQDACKGATYSFSFTVTGKQA